MDVEELESLLLRLRAEGSDTADVEVKAAVGGLPTDLATTFSAFANTPGGGVVVLGVDERAGFAVVGVYDAAAAMKAMVAVARQSLDPPVVVHPERLDVAGHVVVVVRVREADLHAKPVRVGATGRAYLRAYDGDYVLSHVEEQAFVASRSTPVSDHAVVAGTSVEDLDEDLLRAYIASCRASSSSLAAMPDDEVLFRTGVTAGRGQEVTVAGLLSLGVYPQQHLPNCVIQASVAPGVGDTAARAEDVRRFDGPIPVMLDEALRWVQRSSRTRLRRAAPGVVRDEPEYPLDAVRELLSNALIHRDLGAHALTTAVTLRLDDARLVVSNPGGLWGITVDRLGLEGITSARNGRLLRICQNVRTRAGDRVVEALATGIPTVLRSLREAGMVAPRFQDRGIGFTVLVPNHALLSVEDLAWLAGIRAAQTLDDRQRHALAEMRRGAEWTNQSYRDAFPMDSREATRALAEMVEAGVAVARGERRARTYALAPALSRSSSADSGAPGALGARGVDRASRRGDRSANAERVVAVLGGGPLTTRELVDRTGLTSRQLGYALDPLRRDGRVRLEGGQGVRGSRYHLVEP
ncbi:RNA-binding domain-containing protein [Pseudokineococcus basanitobsidens]|uniref:RNA-binding domain-containing protein n=1 Tax=Pseudokineococcus basanitobsidens TaxID=1926649 RepID=A0ABU8RGX4_9ACTN